MTDAPVPLAEQIAAVERAAAMFDRWAELTDKSPETRSGHLAERDKLRLALATLQQHERAMAVVEAAYQHRIYQSDNTMLALCRAIDALDAASAAGDAG